MSAPTPVSKYSLTVQITQDTNITLVDERLTPPGTITEVIRRTFREAIIPFYLHEVGLKNFLEMASPATARLILSPRAITVENASDQRLEAIIKGIPLVNWRCYRAATFDLSIAPLRTAENSRIHTSYLHFPHLLFELNERLKGINNPSICIVGPGLIASTCPQLVEIYGLYPNARYEVLDKNEGVLKRLQDSIHKAKMLAYDPTTLIRKTDPQNCDFIQKYQPLFQTLKTNLAERALNGKAVNGMYSGAAPSKPFAINVDPEKMKVRNFDVDTSKFEQNEEKKFDAIFATAVFLNVFMDKRGPFNSYSVIGKFLLTLKENGSLYMDDFGFGDLPQTVQEQGKKYLESVSGHEIEILRIPMSDFIPGLLGRCGCVESVLHTDDLSKKVQTKMFTTNCMVFKRLPRRAEPLNQQEMEKLDAALAKETRRPFEPLRNG